MSTKEFAVEVDYIDRVKHVHSRLHTSDEEVAFAETIEDQPELIEVISDEDTTEVIVYTEQGVYHLHKLRTQYHGHAPRDLVQALFHFGVSLPLSFIVAHQSFKVYLNGDKVIDEKSGDEYQIAPRNDVYELVEPVEWLISSEKLDTIYRWAEKYAVSPAEIVEQTVQLLGENGFGEKVEGAE